MCDGFFDGFLRFPQLLVPRVCQARRMSDPNAVFDLIDSDKSGEIDPTELVLYLLGQGQEHESVSALFSVLDTNNNGSISREEFMAGFDKLKDAESSAPVLMTKLNISADELAELRADFDEIDAGL